MMTILKMMKTMKMVDDYNDDNSKENDENSKENEDNDAKLQQVVRTEAGGI